MVAPRSFGHVIAYFRHASANFIRPHARHETYPKGSFASTGAVMIIRISPESPMRQEVRRAASGTSRGDHARGTTRRSRDADVARDGDPKTIADDDAVHRLRPLAHLADLRDDRVGAAPRRADLRSSPATTSENCAQVCPAESHDPLRDDDGRTSIGRGLAIAS